MIALTLALALSLLSGGGDLDAVRELYASAAFDDALARLERLDTNALTPDERVVVHQYKAACLFALGRTANAEQAMEALIRSAPEFPADRIDGSPRLRARFDAVRTRVLPQVLQELYGAARRAYAEKTPDAAAQLERVRKLLDEAPLREGPSAETFADLRMVVDGLLELTRARNAVPKIAATAPAAEPARNLFTAADTDVLAPKILRQTIPKPPTSSIPGLSFAGSATIQVTVGADGRVERVGITQSLHPVYDAMLKDAAKSWRYEPARRNGTPVRYVKTVMVKVVDPERRD